MNPCQNQSKTLYLTTSILMTTLLKNKARLKKFHKKKFDSESNDDESEVEVFVETDKEKIKNGHPVKIKSYHSKNKMKHVYIAKGPQVMTRHQMDSIIPCSSNGRKKYRSKRSPLKFKVKALI
ncbi:hypothetical protein QVD17_38095 [Tagetes erecta]|uniref:Uncharacterized protein n=1 Tax=Tagetes erecta TaxID=13708 RepID=A0AAD8JV74_TARER|nr:hypothetical protein QVD17_38095 [Tagetes erecta]